VIAATPDASPCTTTGIGLPVLELFPSWPSPLLPQHRTPPVLVSAQVCEPPAEIAATPVPRPEKRRPARRGHPAERLRERVAAMVVAHEGQRIAVTVSVGVAGFPGATAETPEALVAAADAALYEAKRQGRNRIVLLQSSRTMPSAR
jgi:hypothetical protein